MPSIQDVADQINARLDQVSTHTANTAQNTADLLVISQGIRAEMNVGFANLTQGLFALLQVQLAALNLLEHHRQQNDTIICELTRSNDLLCRILRNLAEEVRLSTASLESIDRVEGIQERVHCCEAADYDRGQDILRRVERCCPPPAPPAEPCPEPCDKPEYRPRKPEGQDWKPLPSPQRPIG